MAIDQGAHQIWSSSSSSRLRCWRDIEFDSSKACYDFTISRKSRLGYEGAPNLEEKLSTLNGAECFVDPIDQKLLLMPLWERPQYELCGVPALVKAQLLNNKIQVVTENEEKHVVVWDILQCKKISEYPGAIMPEVVDSIQQKEWVANWCWVDITTGVGAFLELSFLLVS